MLIHLDMNTPFIIERLKAAIHMCNKEISKLQEIVTHFNGKYNNYD